MNMALHKPSSLSTTQLGCHIIGLDKRGIATFQLFFKKHCGDRCEIVSEDQADVFMLNMDSIEAEKKLAELEAKFPAKPIILLGLYPIETEKHYSISKPINAKKLLVILNIIEQQNKNNAKQKAEVKKNTGNVFLGKDAKAIKKQTTSHATTDVAQQLSQTDLAYFIGTRKDVDLSDNDQKADIYFDPKRYYLGHVMEALELAKKDNKSIQLTGMSHTLYLCPNQNLVCIALSDNKLRYYGVTALYNADITDEDRNRFSYKLIDDEEVITLSEKSPKYKQELCAFLWKLSLWTARGRLPKGVDLDRPFSLKEWPNFTRLVQIPHALRISAYWIEGPKTLRAMAESLFIEQRYLFSFFTASYMTGRSNVITGDNEDAMTNTKDNKVNSEREEKTKGIFSRLIKKLTND
jgi:hypothetical protein